MNKIFTLTLLVLASLVANAQTPPGDWKLTFSDEFNSSSIDNTKWKLGAHHNGKAAVAAIWGDNVTVENGNLVIEGKKEDVIYMGKNEHYTAAHVTTFKRFRQKYGYFEARIKYDALQGLWPAFWTMPERDNHGNDKHDKRTFLQFDISSAPSSITSAKLRVKVIALDAGFKNITIHRLLEEFDETTVTYNSMPKYDAAWITQLSGTYAVTDPNNQLKVDEFIEVDVLDFVKAQKVAGNKAGFAIVDEFLRQSQVQFASKETGNSADKPVLVINGSTKIYPSDDAYVQGKDNADTNFGTEAVLDVKDPWAKTSSTSDGGMEFDIMEALGVWGPNKIQNAVHWDDYGDDHKHVGSGDITFPATTDGYHVYGMNWQDGKVEFYVDGNKTWTREDERIGSVESFILLSLQLGTWPSGGNSIVDSNLPSKMYIDYVHVYEGNLSNSEFSLNSSSLKIYPNPLNGKDLSFSLNNISTQNKIDYNILDIMGRVVYSSSEKVNFSDKIEVKVSLKDLNLKKGIYLLSVDNGNSIITKRFIY